MKTWLANLFHKFLFIIPRPSLYWLSRQDVISFRNNLYNLYETNELAIPDSKFFVRSGVAPQFRIEGSAYFLNCQDKTKNPYWVTHTSDPERKPIYIAFNDESVLYLSKLVKELIHRFPFKPTDNFLLNGGHPIA